MSDTSSTMAWGLNLQLDAYWFVLPVGEGTDDSILESQLATRIEREPEVATYRDELLGMLQDFTAAAQQRRAIRAGFRWMVTDLGSALAVMHLFAYQSEPGTVDQQIEALQEQITVGWEGRYVAPPAFEVRELPAGRALRNRMMTEAARGPKDPGDEAPILDTVEYWIPVPGERASLLVVFSTPNLVEADLMVEEFDQIMERNLQLEL